MDSRKIGWIIITILVVVIIALKLDLLSSTKEFERKSLLDFPYTLGEWKGEDLEYPDWLSDELKAEELIMREYEDKDGNNLMLYAGFFTYRKSTSTHNPDVCYPAQGWKIEKKDIVKLDIDGRSYPVAERIISKNLNRQVVLFWYQVKDKTITNKIKHQMLIIKDALIEGKMRASIVRVSMPIKNRSIDEALEIEKEFAEIIIPKLSEYLP